MWPNGHTKLASEKFVTLREQVRYLLVKIRLNCFVFQCIFCALSEQGFSCCTMASILAFQSSRPEFITGSTGFFSLTIVFILVKLSFLQIWGRQSDNTIFDVTGIMYDLAVSHTTPQIASNAWLNS